MPETNLSIRFPPRPPDDIARQALSTMYGELRSGRKISNVESITSLLDTDIGQSLKAKIAGILLHHFFHAGIFDRAARYGTIACDADPADLEAQKGLIAALSRLGRWNEVSQRLKQLLTEHDEDFDCHSLLGTALGHLERLDEAHAHGIFALAR